MNFLKLSKGKNDKSPDELFHKKDPKLHYLWVLLPLIIAGGLYALSDFLFHHVADPLADDTGPNAFEFIELFASNNLEKLSDIGPRLVGSEANEITAIQFLTNAVEEIKSKALSQYQIEYEVQTATLGSYIIDDMVDIYKDIKNFVVRFSSRGQSTSSCLMLNSHFDTVPESSGAGDDGTMVVVMLEILRVLSITNETLRYPVVFLFNGAEENSMQGSHAFITQHRWAKDIKAFVNLDVAGLGGREMLFQASPGYAWLVDKYSESAIYPYANTIAEEAFHYDLVPSDTDFRVFSKYANIPGLDIAQAYNGYVYHSKLDKFSSLDDEGSLQNIGENVLALVQTIANSKELENPPHSDGRIVFFDFMGLFLISYSETVGIAINIAMVVISVTTIFGSLWSMGIRLKTPKSRILKKFGVILLVQIATHVFAIGILFILGVIIDAAKASMFWYDEQFLVFGIYFCPYLFIVSMVPAVFLSWRKNDIPLRFRLQMFLHAYCIILCVIIIVMTSLGLRSTYVVTMAIFFYIIAALINWLGKMQKKAFLWLIPVLILQIIPFHFYAYLAQIIFTTFIPITGRSGCTNSPEIIIVAFTVVVSILLSGFLAPLFSTLRKPKTIISAFGVLFVIFAIMMATNLGFPYDDLAPQRQWVFHTERTSYDIDGVKINKNDSGYILLPLDRRSPQTIEELISNMNYKSTGDDCETMLVCGVPVYASNYKYLSNYSYWVPAPPPVISDEFKPYIKVLSRSMLNETIVRFDMEISGPAHLQVFFNPLNQSQLVDWSVNEDFPKKDYFQESLYFLHFRHGMASKSFTFYLQFEIPRLYDGPIMDIALIAHHNNYPVQHTAEFTTFLSKFPAWVTLTPILIMLTFLFILLCSKNVESKTIQSRQRERERQPAEERVRIQVFRGPNDDSKGTQWGFYVIQPADSR